MIFVEPKVELIAETKMDHEATSRYLQDIGASDYEIVEEASDIENLIQIAGKACYKAFQPGLNPNVTRVRTDIAEYMKNINKVGHGSITEHGSVSFIFWNVSRVFTHELVRHRAGTAMSQESLRYVRLNNLSFWIPSIIDNLDNDGKGRKLFEETVVELEKVQQKLSEIYKIDEIKDFATKKLLTSAFRRVAPIGLSTAIVWTMNLRAARHLIQMRTSRHAEEEIRLVFDKVAQAMSVKYPHIMGDLCREEIDGYGEWTSEFASTPYDGEKIKKLEKLNKELEEKVRSLEALAG